MSKVHAFPILFTCTHLDLKATKFLSACFFNGSENECTSVYTPLFLIRREMFYLSKFWHTLGWLWPRRVEHYLGLAQRLAILRSVGASFSFPWAVWLAFIRNASESVKMLYIEWRFTIPHQGNTINRLTTATNCFPCSCHIKWLMRRYKQTDVAVQVAPDVY